MNLVRPKLAFDHFIHSTIKRKLKGKEKKKTHPLSPEQQQKKFKEDTGNVFHI